MGPNDADQQFHEAFRVFRSILIGGVIAALLVGLHYAYVTYVAGLMIAGGQHLDADEQCMSNVKRASLALLMYVADNDDRMPLATEWSDAVTLYFDDAEVLVCPLLPDEACGYSYNERIGDVARDVWEEAGPPTPSDVPMFFDGPGGWNAAGGEADVRYRHGPDTRRDDSPGAHVSFADGHAEWLRQEDMRNQAWAPPPEAAPKEGNGDG
jgi:prepilin-type processing-associated H-X9-DG protein